MRFYLISDNIDTLTGMRLAGIEGTVVHDAAGVSAALKKAVDDEDIGVVLITERLGALCESEVSALKLSSRRPLIVEVPDRHGGGRSKDAIAKYVRESIGVKI